MHLLEVKCHGERGGGGGGWHRHINILLSMTGRNLFILLSTSFISLITCRQILISIVQQISCRSVIVDTDHHKL